MTVGFGVHAFAVEGEVVCQGVDECALLGRHGLEAQTLLGRVGGEDSEFPFLRLPPCDVFLEHAQRLGRVGYMFILVCFRIDVESQG